MYKHKFLIFTISLLFYTNIIAQQDAQFTHYMYNMNILNPAYAGSKESLSIGLLGRTQWVGFEDAPQTLTAAIHAPLGKKIGAGFSVVLDEHGPISEQNIYADLSYTVKTSKKSNLAFGLKGGATLYNVNPDKLQLPYDHPASADVAFDEHIKKTSPNVGAGILFYSIKHYIGFSVPNILQTEHYENNSEGKTHASEIMHGFLAMGYVFDLNEKLKFKPSTLLKLAMNSPLSVDLSANFLFNEKFEIGANYRLDDSISALFLLSTIKDLRIGYAYDYTLSNLGKYNDGSHEIILLWDIQKSQSEFKSPRFF